VFQRARKKNRCVLIDSTHRKMLLISPRQAKDSLLKPARYSMRRLCNRDYGLPESHPTLVRMHHQLGLLKRKAGDVDGAEFAEKESIRWAKAWVEEQLKRSKDGRSVGYEVYLEDARFLKELLKGQAVLNASAAARAGGAGLQQQTDAQEVLATPRPLATGGLAGAEGGGEEAVSMDRTFSRVQRQMSPNVRHTMPPPIVGERPTRSWVDG
jgi:hypothetical protein